MLRPPCEGISCKESVFSPEIQGNHLAIQSGRLAKNAYNCGKNAGRHVCFGQIGG